MAEIWTMGEMLVEIMRTKENSELYDADYFKGPYPSGAPAIFIDTVARLGHKAGIISGVGTDDFGKCILNRLEKDEVDVSQVLVDPDNSTGCAFVTYYSDGSRKFIFHLANTPAVAAKAPCPDTLKGVRYFHVMGCSLFARLDFAREILKAVKTARNMGAKISFDPNIRKELMKDEQVLGIVKELLSYTNIFLPGREELLLLTGCKDVEEAVSACMKMPEMEILALKQGSKGCEVYTKDEVIRCGAYKIDAVDATGAGDSFDGAFICGLAEGKTLEETVKMASAAGALNTASFGPMEGDISPMTVEKMIKEETV